MPEEASFGQWLKRRRKELDLSQEELAERIGCSGSAIRKIEAGQRRPSKQVTELLLGVLEIPAPERAAFKSLARGFDDQPDATAATNRPSLRPPGNLPARLTRLIGREEAIADITLRLEQDDTRLLTLTGPPGVGKTSLALQVASDLTGHFRDGVFFVALAPVVEPALVTATIARVFGLTESSRTLEESLIDFVGDKHLLLLLDNFEQVLDASSVVRRLLGASPNLKVLVTSREALHMIGAQAFQVRPLPTASPARIPPVETLLTYPAIALFVERARAVKLDFHLSEQNAQALATICARLDGLPLAIELAAAHIRLLTPQEMQALFDTRLPLPASGLRDMPARQQTLTAAIDWSYSLLNQEEQTLLARLSAFVSGCSLAAVEAVCNASGDLQMGVLSSMASLVDKSLVQRQEDAQGASRFTMLEIIREYAAEHLVASGEDAKIKLLHAEYYLALAEVGEQASKGAEQYAWSERFEREHENLRAALRWTSHIKDMEMTLRLAGALGWFWEARAHITEGQEWLAEVLSWANASRMPASRSIVKALNAAGRLSYRQGKVAQARALLEENVAVCRLLDDRWSLLESLQNLGHVAGHQGDFASARIWREESLAISRELGDKWAIAGALIGLGDQRIEDGDLEAARAAFEESRTTYELIRSDWGAARALNGLGDVARCRGDYGSARALYEESLKLYQQLGTKGFMDLALHNLGHVAHHKGNLAQARRYFEESLVLFQEQGQSVGVGVCLVGLAGVTSSENATQAAVLLGAAKTLLDSMGYQMDRLDRMEYSRYASEVYSSLDTHTRETCHELGRNMTMEQAIAYALKSRESTVVERTLR